MLKKLTYLRRGVAFHFWNTSPSRRFSKTYRQSKFVEREIRNFENNLRIESVLPIKKTIINDYLCVSAELESFHANSMHDVSGPYEYYSRRKCNENYCNIYRKKSNSLKEEDVLNLDKISSIYNQMLTMIEFKLSQCHAIAAVIVNFHESERYAIIVKDIVKNVACEVSLPRHIQPLSIELVSSFSEVYIYVTVSSDGVRPSEVLQIRSNVKKLFGQRGWTATQRMRTIIPDNDAITSVICDSRPAFFLSLCRSKDDRFLFVHHHSKTSSQISLLDVQNPRNHIITLKTAVPAEQMFADHIPGYFYVAERKSTDADLTIKRFPSQSELLMEDYFSRFELGEHIWPSATDRAKGYFVEDYDIFKDHLVVYGRSSINGGLFVQLIRLCDGVVIKEHSCASLVPTLGTLVTTLTPRSNGNYMSGTTRFAVSSPLLPEASFEMDLVTGELTPGNVVHSALVTQRKSCGSIAYNYTCENLLVNSTNGYKFPIILCGPLLENHTAKSGDCLRVDTTAPRPTLLYGYGSYGVSIPTHYLSEVAVLVSRGWNIAFAYVRGGGELGRAHHRAGTCLHKWNSFIDFRAAAQFLIDSGYSTPSLLCASGNSAGGLIMGVLLNRFHHLFAAVLMRNPFLGIYDAVQDPSSPLVIHEYDEWGDLSAANDEHRREIVRYIRSYSPLDNVIDDLESTLGPVTRSKHTYPLVYLTIGLKDDRVDPLHAMLWTERFRKRSQQHVAVSSSAVNSKADDVSMAQNHHAIVGDRVVVRIQENCGHDGPSTVEEQAHEAAMEILFLESVVGAS